MNHHDGHCSESDHPPHGTGDLGEVLSGKHSLVKPSILERADGECVVYPGKVHCIFGVPESAKSWLALEACRQELLAGEVVWYLDFEDDARSVVVDRLVGTMGVTDDVVVGQLACFNPDGRVTDAVFDHLLSPRAAAPAASASGSRRARRWSRPA